MDARQVDPATKITPFALNKPTIHPPPTQSTLNRPRIPIQLYQSSQEMFAKTKFAPLFAWLQCIHEL